MKNDKKTFILIEAVLAVLILVLAIVMISEKRQDDRYKISVVVPNSDDRQWSAFKYGLRMAAADNNIEMSVASTAETLTVQEEERLLRDEIENGADALILYPVPGEETEEMLQEIGKKVPIMLVGSALTDGEDTVFPVTEPDHYTMGKALGEELIKDYEGKLDGKTLGINRFGSSDKPGDGISGCPGGFKCQDPVGGRTSLYRRRRELSRSAAGG